MGSLQFVLTALEVTLIPGAHSQRIGFATIWLHLQACYLQTPWRLSALLILPHNPFPRHPNFLQLSHLNPRSAVSSFWTKVEPVASGKASHPHPA